MHLEPVLATVIAVVGLLLIAAAASIGLKRVQFPFTVGLVLVGLILGALRHRVEALDVLGSLTLSPDLILFVFLPTLIFESAFNLDVRLLSRNMTQVLTLAAPGLLLSTAIVGTLVNALKRGEICETLPVAEPLEVRVAEWWIRLLKRVSASNRVVQRHRLRTLAAAYERDTAILSASERVTSAIRELAELSNVHDSVAEKCRSVYETRMVKAMERIDAIAEHFPEYANAVQERTARRIALDAEADAVERLAAAGSIPDSVAKKARRRVETAQRQLARKPIEPMEPDPAELLHKVPFFQELSPQDFQMVAQHLIPRTVLQGENVIVQGERGTSLFLIARGVVAVLVESGDGQPRRVASLHAGDFFGEMALLSAEPHSATVRAATPCQLYELAKQDVDRLSEVCTGVHVALTDAAVQRREAGRRPSGRVSQAIVQPEGPGQSDGMAE